MRPRVLRARGNNLPRPTLVRRSATTVAAGGVAEGGAAGGADARLVLAANLIAPVTVARVLPTAPT
jgi:hypothetical protein